MTKRSVSKLVNVSSVFESWVVLSALDVLETFATFICYCNPVPSHSHFTSILFIKNVIKLISYIPHPDRAKLWRLSV